MNKELYKRLHQRALDWPAAMAELCCGAPDAETSKRLHVAARTHQRREVPPINMGAVRRVM